MIKNLEFHNINKIKRYIPFDVNNSSKIYYDDGVLHKIPYCMDYDLPKTLSYIDEHNIKWTVKVLNFIEKDNKIVGYTMKKYEDYKSLAKHKSRSIDLKIEDCQRMINIFQYFNSKNLIYGDYHTSNILLNKNDNDIKVCDLDNFRVCDYSYAKKNQLGQVMKVCVEYLYNLYPEEADIIVDRSSSGIDSKSCIRDCIKAIGKKDFGQKVKRLKTIDRNAMDSDRRKIKQEAKEYIESGYYKLF